MADAATPNRMNRLLTRDFILNWGASFIGYLSFYLIQQPVMPLYVQSIGGGPQQIGVVIGATSLATLLARPLAGRATDSVGRRALIMAGMGGCGLCAVAYGVAGALALLLAVRFAYGLSLAAWEVAGTTYMVDLTPAERSAEAASYYGIGNNLALGLGPAVGALMLGQDAAFNMVFVTAAVLSIGGALIIVPVRESPRRTAPNQVGPGHYISRQTIVPAMLLVSVTLVYGALSGFVGPYAIEMGIGTSGVAWFWGTYAAVLCVVRLRSGWLADRYGHLVSVALGLVLVGLSLWAIAAGSMAGFVVGAAAFAVGFAFFYPALLATAMKQLGADDRGAGVATFTAGFDIGIGCGSILFGIVAGFAGYQVSFALAALAPFAALGCVILRLCRPRSTSDPGPR